MSDIPRRRWLRFSLRALLIVVTLAAIWLGWQAEKIHHRCGIVRWVIDNGGSIANGGLLPHSTLVPFQVMNSPVDRREIIGAEVVGDLRLPPLRTSSFNTALFANIPPAQLSWWRKWLGDVAVTRVELPENATDAEVLRAAKAFPEASLIDYQHWSQEMHWSALAKP